jgi:hypothetical protein
MAEAAYAEYVELILTLTARRFAPGSVQASKSATASLGRISEV